MKKILLFLLSLLVILLIAGCLPQERDLDIPEELRPPEEALAGQAVFDQLTARQLNDGIVLGLKDTVRWPADMPVGMSELPVEVAFRSIQGRRVTYIYSYTDRKYYFPEGSVNFGLTPKYQMKGLIFDTVRPNRQYYIVSAVGGSILQLSTVLEDSGPAIEDFELTLTTNGRCDREGHGEDIDGKSHVCQMSDEGGLRWKRIVREYCDDSVQCKRGLVCGSGFHRSLVRVEEFAYYGRSLVCLGTEGSDCSGSLDCLDGMGIGPRALRCEYDLITGRRCVALPQTNGRCQRAGDPLNINGIPHMCENVAGENVAPQLEWRRAVNQICDNTAQCLLRTSCEIGDRGDARCLGQENYSCSGDSYSCLSNYKCGPDQRCVACLPVELAPDERCVRCPRVNMYDYRGAPAQWDPIGGLTGSGAHVFAVNIADEIQLPEQPVSSLLADRFTFAFWYNPGAVADIPTFGFRESGIANAANPFASYDTGINFGNERQHQLLNPLPLALVNRWTHYAIVDDGTNYIVYVNGEELFRGLISVNPGSAGNKVFRMGDSGFSGTYADAFNGKIDESFIFDFGLSRQQILDLYNKRGQLQSDRRQELDGCVKPVG